MKKILLHACCAPCSVSVVEKLKSEGFDITLFWHNPNVHPYTEFKIRKSTLEQYAKSLGLKFVDGGVYDVQTFLLNLNNRFSFIERCYKCYFLRIKACVEFAKKEGFEVFSTTLLVSPYQNHEQIKTLAFKMAKEFELEFYYSDFRVLFKQGQQKARELGLYMQKYCGCIFSEEERFCSRSKRKLAKQIKFFRKMQNDN